MSLYGAWKSEKHSRDLLPSGAVAVARGTLLTLVEAVIGREGPRLHMRDGFLYFANQAAFIELSAFPEVFLTLHLSSQT